MRCIDTDDGSSTIIGLEAYHSTYGAFSESVHVFINNGLLLLGSNPHIRILDVGFGMGLNSILTWLYQPSNCFIDYVAIEPFPISFDMLYKIKIPQLSQEWMHRLFILHSLPWNACSSLTEKFLMQKVQATIQDAYISDSVDLIYFDAFSPNVQPDVWSESVLKKCFLLLNTSGILVTYCSKGIVKERLRQSGFQVKRLPGPVGKRHMILAKKF